MSLAAVADPHVLDILSGSIAASVQASLPASSSGSVSVTITSITDVATGVIIFGGARRRLQSSTVAGSLGVSIAYTVLLPPSVSVAAVQAAVLPSGTASVAFAARVASNIVAAAATSSYPAISSGMAGVGASVASPPASIPAASTGGAAGPPVTAAAAGAVGAAVLLTVAFGTYRLLSRKPQARVAPSAQADEPARKPQVPGLTLRVVQPPGAASTGLEADPLPVEAASTAQASVASASRSDV